MQPTNAQPFGVPSALVGRMRNMQRTAMALPRAPSRIHGLNLPVLKWHFSTMKPMMGSLMPSQTKATMRATVMTPYWALNTPGSLERTPLVIAYWSKKLATRA